MRLGALLLAFGVLVGTASAADPLPSSYRFQWSAGLAYSPMREYAVIHIPDGNDLVSKKRGATLLGFEGRWAPVQHSFQVGLRGDLVLPLGPSTAAQGVSMSQNIVRITARGLYALRGNLYEGPYVFGGVTSSRVFTKFQEYSLRETQSGVTAGAGYSYCGYGRVPRPWYRPTEYELGLHRLPTTSRGTQAGGLTLEGRIIFQF